MALVSNHKRRKRRLLPAIAMLIAALVLARAFVIDTAAVRSPSMAPCLGGALPAPDHLLVLRPWAFGNHWRRYDLTTFPDPNSDPEQPTESVKRVVGLPNENIALRDGDLLVNGELERKPHALFDRLLVLLAELRQGEEAAREFLWTKPQGAWEAGGLRLVAAQEPARLRFEGPYAGRVTDGYRDAAGRFHDGATPPISVGDVRFELELEALDDGLVEIVLRDEGSLYQAQFSPSFSSVILDGEEHPIATLFRTGHAYRLDFYNIDQTVGLWLDGKELFTRRVVPIPAAGETRNTPELSVIKGRVLVRKARLSRDLYWTGTAAADLHADEYFVLGDNAAASVDSRQFGPVAGSVLRGRPVCICYPFHRRRLL